jgi:dTDP-4-amino-4,6-dideoxygalactose transaminase
MITTNREDFYKKLLQFRTHGITRDVTELYENQGPWYYEMQFLGFNYRITDIQSALGVSQLKKVNQFIEKRKRLVQLYQNELQKINELQFPYQLPNVESSWHILVVKLNLEKLNGGRREVFEALQKENIGVNVHYLPVHLHPYYQGLGYRRGICPIAERCYEEFITLPLYPGMSEQDVLDVVAAVKKVINYFRKE